MSNRKQTETEIEKAERLVKRKAEILNKLNNTDNVNEIIEIDREIFDLIKEGYKDRNEVILIRKAIKDKLSEMKKETETRRQEIIGKQKAIKSEVYSENMEEFQKLSVIADKILLELFMKLGTNETRNKMVISEAMNKNDRATALALIKLSQTPVYSSYFGPTMKEKILMVAKSESEKKWEESQNKRIEEVGRDLGSLTMRNFLLGKAENMIDKHEKEFLKNQ